MGTAVTSGLSRPECFHLHINILFTEVDFFSGSGSSYVIGKAVNTEREDWDV